MIINHDSSKQVRENWPLAMKVWRKLLGLNGNDSDKKKDETTAISRVFQLRLTQTDDGIWFIHVGPFVLAATAITDEALIISWSPAAVRHNVTFLKGKRITPTGGGQSRGVK